MSKISFNKLGLKKPENNIVSIAMDNGEIIEVKQYLPINDRVDLISRIVGYSMTDQNYVNPIQVDFVLLREVIFAYTNITFTEKQKEDFTKCYDLMMENGLIDKIMDAIPEDELNRVENSVWEVLDSLYAYKTSVLGVLEGISQNYDNLQFDTTKIGEEMRDPNNLTLVKELLTKMG